MGPYPSARRGIAAVVLLAVALVVVCGCNGLLGTPEPELAPEGGTDGAALVDATNEVDATTADDGTTGQDGTTPQDSPTKDAVGQDAGDATLVDAAEEDASGMDVVVGDAASLAPSCPADGGPGVSTCGPAGDSCCTSIPLLGGTYYRGFSTGPDGGPTGFTYQATVSPFRLDKYEVTVGRFRQFVNATKGWAPEAGAGVHAYLNDGGGLVQLVDGGRLYESGWDSTWNAEVSQKDGGGEGYWGNTLIACAPASTWTNFPSTQESLPINCLNWYEAYEFCIWDGGFLPSELEWEFASAGGNLQREYPWGTTDPGVANQYGIYGCDYPNGGQPGVDASETCNSVANIAPVGSAPLGAGLWSQLDLGGNVHESAFDNFVANYYPGPCDDCAQITPGVGKVARGGSWAVQGGAMASYSRYSFAALSRDARAGVRCARAP